MRTIKTTDSKGRVTLGDQFADCHVFVEEIDETEVRITKACIIPMRDAPGYKAGSQRMKSAIKDTISKFKIGKNTSPRRSEQSGHYLDIYKFIATNPKASLDEVFKNVDSAADLLAQADDAEEERKIRNTCNAAREIGLNGLQCAVAVGVADPASLPDIASHRPAGVNAMRIAGVDVLRPDALRRRSFDSVRTKVGLYVMIHPEATNDAIAIAVEEPLKKTASMASQARSVRRALVEVGIVE